MAKNATTPKRLAPPGSMPDRPDHPLVGFNRGRKPRTKGPVSMLHHGWNAKTGTWDPGSLAARLINGINNGMTLTAAVRTELGFGSDKAARAWRSKGEFAIGQANLDPEVLYEQQRHKVPWKVRIYTDFLHQLARAAGNAQAVVEGKLRRSILDQESPSAMLAWLARRDPEQWSEKYQVDAQVTVDSPLVGILTGADPDVLEALVALADVIATKERSTVLEIESGSLRAV